MLKITVPATSANLGIGYDCLGAALDWRSSFRFAESETLRIDGCPEEYRNRDNLVVRSFAHAAEAIGRKMPPFHLTIESDIPLKRGLGSSAVCITAGVLAANEFSGRPLGKEECLKLACEIEGHPDNLAPAFYGGIVFSSFDGKRVEHYELEAPPLYAALIIPAYPIGTEEARRILPSAIPHKDAAAQVFLALKFAHALRSGDDGLLRESLKDVLHEPYRRTLIKDYDEVRSIADRLNMPFWISGSGSTMAAAAFAEEKREEFLAVLGKERPDLKVCRSKIAKKGAEIVHE